jgi:nucleotide-binding universal stress UspA family protein
MMKTIVVGYDGSDASERALVRAADIADGFHARLVVVSVARSVQQPPSIPAPTPRDSFVPSPSGPFPSTEPLPSDPEIGSAEPNALAARELDDARRILTERGIDAEYIAELGQPADNLLAVADEHDADLIVVASREHSFVDRLLGRAVDETLARKAERDLLLVH